MLRPEQKSEALLKHLITKYTLPGCIVVDPFSGTFSTARACLTLPQPRVFFGWEKDTQCFLQSEQYVINAFLRSIRRGNPMEINTLTIQDQINAFRRYMADKQIERRKASSETPPGLPKYQLFPSHILQFVSTIMSSSVCFDECKHLRYDLWPESAQRVLDTTGAATLRGAEAVAYGLRVGPSLIKHERAGVGVFASKDIVVDNIVCYFYGTILYKEPMKKTYGSGIMGVHPFRFSKYAMQVQNTLKDNNGVVHDRIFVCPAPLCIAGFINDAKYLEGDEEYRKRNLPTRRTTNVIIDSKPTKKFIYRSTLQDYEFFTVRALKHIKAGEELYISYGNEYNWEGIIPQQN